MMYPIDMNEEPLAPRFFLTFNSIRPVFLALL